MSANANRTLPSYKEMLDRLVFEVPANSVNEFAEDASFFEPYDGSVSVGLDLEMAWKDVRWTAGLYGISLAATPVSPEWLTIAARPVASMWCPCGLAQYPQQAYDWHQVIAAFEEKKLPQIARQLSLSQEAKLRKKAQQEPLFAAALARQAGALELAHELLQEYKPTKEKVWLLENEKACLNWAEGNVAAALAIWEKLPVSPIVNLNVALAQLYLGQPANAQQRLQEAIAGLPENTGWYHFAQFLLASV